jgi:hypothetical protein
LTMFAVVSGQPINFWFPQILMGKPENIGQPNCMGDATGR